MTEKLFREQANTNYSKKDWARACQFYDKYFSTAYPQDDEEEKDFSLDDCKLFLNYADALINLCRENKGKSDEVHDDLESAATYLLSARAKFETIPEGERPWEQLVDTYELLGHISLMNGSYKAALDEFSKGYSIAKEQHLSWNQVLSLLFNQVIAREVLILVFSHFEVLEKHYY